MIKDLQVTLYEIFGYIFPGAIVCFSIALLWNVFNPSQEFDFTLRYSNTVLVTLLFVSYLVGHLIQGVGNLMEKMQLVRSAQTEQNLLTPEMSKMVRAAVSKRFGKPESELTFQDIYNLCDQTLLHHGSLGERDILTYREGFYRGCSVALMFPTLAFCVCAVMRQTQVVAVCAAVLSGAGVVLCFQRYKRFYAYRFKCCLIRFLALSTANKGKEHE